MLPEGEAGSFPFREASELCGKGAGVIRVKGAAERLSVAPKAKDRSAPC